ncbi:hypothetical protein [Streptomyces tagetis]|uniref:Uncharacterized protein n=1 Tax=Streptomyces tagetis TaxID=2820809 RepID=A0A941B7N7_9ACTN|nr:hypothetical protein [Streptomyces sp. RG38]MBQ0827653.1 hypothetical protein [Streptomyces sp. RG38]
MKTHIAVQAAVVTMLVAKRPALADLPIRWELAGGRVEIRQDALTSKDDSVVPQIAAELARAMRGARTHSYVLPAEDGTSTRCCEVAARVSGVGVRFVGYQRGLRLDEVAGHERLADEPDAITRLIAPTQALRYDTEADES